MVDDVDQQWRQSGAIWLTCSAFSKKTGACTSVTGDGGNSDTWHGDVATPSMVALDSSYNFPLISRILVDKDGNCQRSISPWGDHSGCALVIARRSKTTHSGVDVNNTHLSMIKPLTKLYIQTVEYGKFLQETAMLTIPITLGSMWICCHHLVNLFKTYITTHQ